MTMRREAGAIALLGVGAALMLLALAVDPGMLVRAPRLGAQLLAQHSSARGSLGALSVLLAVSANLAPLLPLPRALLAAYLVVPWLPLVAARLIAHMRFAAVAALAPSYAPWAASITLLLAGRLLLAARPRPTDMTRT